MKGRGQTIKFHLLCIQPPITSCFVNSYITFAQYTKVYCNLTREDNENLALEVVLKERLDSLSIIHLLRPPPHQDYSLKSSWVFQCRRSLQHLRAHHGPSWDQIHTWVIEKVLEVVNRVRARFLIWFPHVIEQCNNSSSPLVWPLASCCGLLWSTAKSRGFIYVGTKISTVILKVIILAHCKLKWKASRATNTSKFESMEKRAESFLLSGSISVTPSRLN